jgi:hypothetical protein
MHETSYEPRHFDPNRPFGSELTLGSIGKLSNAVADVLASIADLNRRLDRLEGRDESPRPIIRESQP